MNVTKKTDFDQQNTETLRTKLQWVNENYTLRSIQYEKSLDAFSDFWRQK